MSTRFFRRTKIGPGLSLNLSKSGLSTSFGPRGLKATLSNKGVRRTVGIPGTGFYQTEMIGSGRKNKAHSSTRSSTPDTTRPESFSFTAFLARLFAPRVERTLVAGIRSLRSGDEGGALSSFMQSCTIPDGSFLAGYLLLKQNHIENAISRLRYAADNHASLGKVLAKHGVSITISFPITPELMAEMGPDLRGTLLLLTEAYQATERQNEAIEVLRRLRDNHHDDLIVRVSLAEILSEKMTDDESSAQDIVELADGISNQSEVHTILMLYKARALRHLGLLTAARDTLTEALRHKKGRSDDLLRAVRYERALTYEAMGQGKRYRNELEHLYAEDSAYEDVARRLGLRTRS